MSLRLLLVRHGLTEWNREGRFQGHRDAPLSDDGRTEAQLLGERLAANQIDGMRLITSPLSRAADTASIVAESFPPALRPAITTDDRLIEIGQGEWEGQTHAELAANDGERYAAWRAGAGIEQPPGAETIEHAYARVSAALDDIDDADGPAACLVSHGGILRLVARRLLNLEAQRAWSMDVDNASLSVLSRLYRSAGWRVEGWNDTGHLLGRTAQHLDESDGQPLAL